VFSVHFYDYTIDQWVADKFRIPRFASEYGIEAWCNLDTVRSVFLPSDLAYCSAQADHRQHHLGGQDKRNVVQLYPHMVRTWTFKQEIQIQIQIREIGIQIYLFFDPTKSCEIYTAQSGSAV
jgi:hypothetical protein